MYTPRQIWRQVTPKAQLLLALSLIAVLAFSAGLASGIYGRATAPLALTTNGLPTTAVVVPQPQAQRYLLGGHGELVAGASNAQAASHITAASPALIGSGSAYDGQSYRSPQTALNAAIGTGSVYDGGQYGAPQLRWPNAPVIGSGSAYDGRQYGSPVSAPQTSPNVPISGTGSAYDGGHYGSPVGLSSDTAAQSVLAYLRVHHAVETQPLDPAQQSVMNYLRAHSKRI